MDSGKEDNPQENSPTQTGSFFLDGLTFSPGSSRTEEIPLPAPTNEFKFLRVLGIGGMGVVFETEEFRTGRHVALKIIAPHLSMSEGAVTRFEQEARSSASLSHPNCVFVYGAYRVGASPAIAMELMHGDTLDDRIKAEETISVSQAVTWTNQILEGLNAAHSAGLIHRDIKPSNIFLAENDEVKIGDFGLTRSTKSDLSLTQSGMFLGSPLYASPEQVRGQDLDVRSDIYSVGATLYALLSSSAPHTSTNIGDLFARIATEDPKPLRQIRDDIPRDLEKIVNKALAKSPKHRFDDCGAFQEALIPFLSRSGSSPRLPFRVVAHVIDLTIFFIVYAAFEVVWKIYVEKETNILIGSSFRATYVAESVHFLHFVVLEGLTGASIGKRLMGLRVITKSGDRPGLLRAAMRLAVLEVPFFLIFVGMQSGFWSFGWYCILMITMRRRNGMRGLHEFGNGTQVIELKERFFAKAREDELLDPTRRESEQVVRKCGHYDLQKKLSEIDGGVLWLGRDERLDRDVWITEGCDVNPPEPTSFHLQYLDRIEDTHANHLVFESPGGASLQEYQDAQPGMPWQFAHQVLIGLVDVLLSDDNVDSINQLWIDRTGKLRSLPFRIGGIQGRDHMTLNQHACCIIFDLESPKSPLPKDIPSEAKPVVLEFLKPKLDKNRLRELRGILVATDSRPRSIARSTRITQMFLSSFFPILMAFSWIATNTLRLYDFGIVEDDHLMISLSLCGVILAPAILFSLIFRGGLGFLVFGIKIVDDRAHRISRLRCLVRSLLVWLPLCVIMVACRVSIPQLSETHVQLGSWALFALWCIGGAYSLWRPTSSVADWATSTHLVR
ncbi:MAG: putative RDD family membrane protein YckC [Planctomycetota bacterium]|jgi:uncharacterized RDD family membrane protein YckC